MSVLNATTWRECHHLVCFMLNPQAVCLLRVFVVLEQLIIQMRINTHTYRQFQHKKDLKGVFWKSFQIKCLRKEGFVHSDCKLIRLETYWSCCICCTEKVKCSCVNIYIYKKELNKDWKIVHTFSLADTKSFFFCFFKCSLPSWHWKMLFDDPTTF